MPDLRTYDYAIVRVVPRVERGEFLNAGIILSCDRERILESRIELDEVVLLALHPEVRRLNSVPFPQTRINRRRRVWWSGRTC